MRSASSAVLAGILITVVAAVKKPETSFALLDIFLDTELKFDKVCVNFQQFYFKQLPTSPDDALSFELNWWHETPENYDVCKGRDSDLGGEIIPLKYVSTDSPVKNEGLSLCDSNITGRYYIRQQMEQLERCGASAALFLLDKGTRSEFHGKNFLHSRFFNPKVDNDTPTFYMYQQQFDEFKGMIEHHQGPTLKFYRPADPFFDGGELALLAIAFSCIAIGCMWYVSDLHKAVADFARIKREGGSLEKFYKQHRMELPSATSSSRPDGDIESSPNHASGLDVPTEPISRANSPSAGSTTGLTAGRAKPPTRAEHCITAVVGTVILLVIVVSVLLLSFFYRSVAVTAFNIILVVVGTSSMTSCLLAFTRLFFQDPKLRSIAECVGLSSENEKWYIPDAVYRRFRPFGFMVFLASFAFALTWYFDMDNDKSIYMLDIMNACLCICAIRNAEIRSLCFVTCFLVAMFFYDVIMVFGTRLLTKNGCSVMVQVVTGVDCYDQQPINYTSFWPYPPDASLSVNTPRRIPILFYMPILNNPVAKCYDPALESETQLMMLGLGDVIAPGYLIAFAFFLDFANGHKWHPYGLTTLFGYAFGLLATFVSLKLMETAQPALIYLVPFTLIPLTVMCLYHGTFRQAWHNQFGNFFDRSRTHV